MGTQVQRYAQFNFDASTLRELPHGGVSVQGQITHPGVFRYRADGKERREYRPDAEVFSPASMASFEDTPITIGHPRAPEGVTRKVSADTWRKDAVGHVRNVRREDANVVADLVIQDGATIAQIRSGKLKELSCGYSLTVEDTPGTSPSGEHYDAVQKDIVGNHVALLPVGLARGGRACVLRVDGHEEVPDAPEAPLGGEGGKAATLSSSMTTAVTPEHAALAVRVDTLEAENTALKTQLADATRLDALVEERSALVAVAATHQIDPKGKTNAQIKAAIVAARSPSLAARADSLSAEALDAAYAVAMERPAPAVAARQAGLAAAVAGPPGTRVDGTAPATRADSLSAARKRNADALAAQYTPVPAMVIRADGQLQFRPA